MNENKPDLVYILGSGSKWMNNEIRFSLRSVEKYLANVGRVFIVGECPSFLRNVIHIPAVDGYENKQKNAVFKIRTACRNLELGEKFILMNDDFFFLKPTPQIQTFTLGTLREAIENHSTKAGYYFQSLRDTLDILQASDIQTPLDYEAHTPILFEKHRFLSITDAIEWEKTGYCFRSIYGNTFGLGGKKRIDTKVHQIEQLEELGSKDILSTADRAVLRPEFQKFIYKHFPLPSKYEDPDTDPGRLP